VFAGSGPSYWEVITKSGLLLEYGKTETSSVYHFGSDSDDYAAEKRSWHLSSITDVTRNNMITIEYQNDECLDGAESGAKHCATTQVYPTAIHYGAPDRSVEFIYEDRPDRLIGMFRGHKVEKNKLLKEVRTFAGTAHIRTYLISYQDPGETRVAAEQRRLATYSNIRTIEDCVPTDPTGNPSQRVCRPPTVFRYSEPRVFSDRVQHTIEGGDRSYALDVNGDGADDIMFVDNYDPESRVRGTERIAFGSKGSAVAPFTSNNRGAAQTALVHGFGRCRGIVGTFDANTDGKEDVAVLCDDTLNGRNGAANVLYIWISNGTGFGPLVRTSAHNVMSVADLDNDGVQEVYSELLRSSGDFALGKVWKIGLTDGCRSTINTAISGDPNQIDWWQSPITCTLGHADEYPLNAHPSSWPKDVCDANDDGSGAAVLCGLQAREQDDNRFAMDLNGDGYHDLIEIVGYDAPWSNTYTLDFALNTGSGLLPDRPFLSDDGDTAVTAQLGSLLGSGVADYNGDGRDDIFMADTADSAGLPLARPLVVWQTKPDLSKNPQRIALSSRGDRNAVGDFNGDGAPDVLTYYPGSPNVDVIWNRNAIGGALRLVRDGLGNVDRFSYDVPTFAAGQTPITSVYTRAVTNCLPPLLCAKIPPSPVVKSLESLAETQSLGSPGPSEVTVRAGQTQLRARTDYAYAGGRYHRTTGRWLGFETTVRTELDSLNLTMRKHTTRYDNTTEGIGKVSYLRARRPIETSTEWTVLGSVLNDNKVVSNRKTVTNEWTEATSLGAGPFIYLSKQTELDESWQSGAFASSIRRVTTQLADNRGNITSRVMDWQNGEVDSVQNVYRPATASEWWAGLYWLRGQPLLQRTERSQVGAGVAVRTTAFEYYGINAVPSPDWTAPAGLLRSIIRDPDTKNQSPDGHYRRTTFYPDQFGNVLHVHQYDADDQLVGKSSQEFDIRGIFPHSVSQYVEPDVALTTQLHLSDAHGGLLTALDPNGFVRQHSYDGYGLLRRTQAPEGWQSEEVSAAIAATNFPSIAVAPSYQVETSASSGARARHQFDSAGKLRRIMTLGLNGQWVQEEFDYDAIGNLRKRSRPHLGGQTSQGFDAYQYDSMGRMTSATTAANATQTFMSAPVGLLWAPYSSFSTTRGERIEASLDEVGTLRARVVNRKSLVLRALERLGTTTGSIGAPAGYVRSSFEYGPFGQLEKTTDASGHATTMSYDRWGRLRYLTDPDLGAERDYRYDALDRLDYMEDGKGDVFWFEYDLLGRMTERRDAHSAHRWRYDGPAELRQQGKLISASLSNANAGISDVRTEYGYDMTTGLLSDVVRRIQSEYYTVGVRYNGATGLPRQMVYPAAGGSSFTIDLGYDPNGTLTRVQNVENGTTYWSLDEVDQGFRPRTVALGNGMSTRTTYDPLRDEIQKIEEGQFAASTFTSLRSIDYSYYANGDVKTRRATKPGNLTTLDTYVYDPLSRLTSVTRSLNSAPATILEDFAYHFDGRLQTARDRDAAGALTSMSYGYTTGRHAASTAGGNTYLYDDNGNQYSRTGPGIPGGAQAVTFNSFNLPLTITTGTGSGVPTTFQYDADFKRVYKRHGPPSSPTATIFIDDLYEHQWSGSSDPAPTGTHTYRVFAGGKTVAEVQRQEVAGVVNPVSDVVRYVHSDRLGTPHLVTNVARGIVAEPEYRAFGRQVNSTPQATGFTGHRLEPEVGLVNMRGRVYDPQLRQFTTPDPYVTRPLSTQGLNRYSYVSNNPVNWTDPSGYQQCDGDCPINIEISGSGGDGGGGGGPPASWPPDDDGTDDVDRSCGDGVCGDGNFPPVGRGGGRKRESPKYNGPTQGGARMAQGQSNSDEGAGVFGGHNLDLVSLERLNEGLTKAELFFWDYYTTLNKLFGPTDIPHPYVLSNGDVIDTGYRLSTGGTLKMVGRAQAGSIRGRAKISSMGGALDLSLPPSSRILSAALKAAGVAQPAQTAAHHIVAGKGRANASEPARAVLARFEIGINDAANGVFLPANRTSANALNAAVHSSVHTPAYYQAVNELLGQATTRQQALEALGAIRQALLSGGFP
jgi:RHS repeat-associated protein